MKDWITGDTLSNWATKLKTNTDTKTKVQRIVSMIIKCNEILNALNAKQKNILDFNPENLMVEKKQDTNQETLKVIDYGFYTTLNNNKSLQQFSSVSLLQIIKILFSNAMTDNEINNSIVKTKLLEVRKLLNDVIMEDGMFVPPNPNFDYTNGCREAAIDKLQELVSAL